jgi:hypothetical protein
MKKRAVLYLRVSTVDQTTANQERELRQIAGGMGCEIVKVYKDHGISGAKGRDKRPAFDAMCRDASRRQFDVVMAWSVDRLGHSLQDLVNFLAVDDRGVKDGAKRDDVDLSSAGGMPIKLCRVELPRRDLGDRLTIGWRRHLACRPGRGLADSQRDALRLDQRPREQPGE